MLWKIFIHAFSIGKTYFFKGKKFWKFNDQYMRVAHEEPKLSAPFWMGCTSNIEGTREENGPTSSGDSKAKSNIWISLLIFPITVVFQKTWRYCWMNIHLVCEWKIFYNWIVSEKSRKRKLKNFEYTQKYIFDKHF